MVDFNNQRKIFFMRFFKNKGLIFILFLTLLGGFLRLYHLEELMTYLGDEGRDMLIVMDIIQGKNFPLIGPPTSIADLYLGPLYYYLITPFVWIFKMNPIGAAVFVAILGILTIPLIYYTVKKIFNHSVAIFASLFYSVSSLTVQFSRSSWNPNPMPFFTTLLILFLFNYLKTKKNIFLYLSVIAFSIMLQLHYIVILLLPFLLFIILKVNRSFSNNKSLLFSFLILLLFLTPLILFDLKHNFLNTKGILTIFKGRSNEGFSFFDLFSRSRDRLRQLFCLFFGFPERDWRTNILSLTAIIIVIKGLFNKKNIARSIILSFFLWGIISIGLYRHSFYPHYLGFLFPFPAIILGIILAFLWSKNKLTKVFSLLIAFLFLINMLNSSWVYISRPPVLNVNLVQKIVQLIDKESRGKQFNFALLAKNNYDDSYRYFFKLWNIPAAYKTEVTQQLFVVCEDEEVCHPQGNPKWEIALFDVAYNGDIKIAGEWTPDPLIKVFKFIANKEVSL